MSSASPYLQSATDLAFKSLQLQMAKLERELQWLDGKSFLHMFAEVVPVTPSTYRTRLQLRAQLPTDFRWGETARQTLLKLIQQPRDPQAAGVKHFYDLADSQDPHSNFLYSLVPSHAEFSLASLATTPRTDVHSGLRKRETAFKTAKGRLWKRLGLKVQGGGEQLAAKDINDLDAFVFPYPDLLALSLPFLGSPVVHCYFGVDHKAYDHAADLLSDLHREQFRALRDAVWPFFMSRLSALASQYLGTEAADGKSAEESTAAFLIEAGGLLLAQEVKVPSTPQFPGLSVAIEDLRRFKKGQLLTVSLPDAWPTNAVAEIQLPEWQLLVPAGGGTLTPTWSAAVEGTDLQCEAVKGLLGNLASVIFRLRASQQAVARRESVISEALGHVRALRDDMGPRLEQVCRQLEVSPRARLRSLMAAIKGVLRHEGRDNEAIAQALQRLKANWHDTDQGEYQGGENLGHFLKAVDQLHATKVRTLLAQLASEVCCCARGLGVGAELTEEEWRWAGKVILLLSATRLWGAESGQKSILTWAVENNLLGLDAVDGADYGLLVRDAVQGDVFIGTRGGLVLESVVIPKTCPPLAVPLFLSVVGSFFHAAFGSQKVAIEAECHQGAIDLGVIVRDPRTRESEPASLSALVRGARSSQGGVSALSVERFGDCLALLDRVYKLADDTPGPEGLRLHAGFNLRLELWS